MTARREDVLKELGLWPVWRLRGPVLPALAAAEPSLQTTPAHAIAVQKDEARPVPPQAAPTASAALSLDARTAQIAQMQWPQLKESVAGCIACPLHRGRNKTVFGVGDEEAAWMFVGEGPGAEEDQKGEPFVGQAGKLLDNMLAAIDLKRGKNVYITNVVKCRPPGNRNPEAAEVAQCEPYLHRQIALIRPKLIVALGKVAAVNLLKRDAAVASMRGKLHEYQGIPLIVTYHPAYLLRSLPEKAKAWVDLRFAVETMQTLQSRNAAPT
jgi:DNA polymerase